MPVRKAEDLSEPIAGLVREAHLREARIREAIKRADLPYEEVADEVDGFVDAIDRTARRAQLLHEALADSPPEKVAARLAEVRDDPDQAGLTEALTTQLATLEKMQRQLKRFCSELERLLVELDTVRSAAHLGVGLDRERPAGRADRAGAGPARAHGRGGGGDGRRLRVAYSPITLMTSRLRRRPSNSA